MKLPYSDIKPQSLVPLNSIMWQFVDVLNNWIVILKESQWINNKWKEIEKFWAMKLIWKTEEKLSIKYDDFKKFWLKYWVFFNYEDKAGSLLPQNYIKDVEIITDNWDIVEPFKIEHIDWYTKRVFKFDIWWDVCNREEEYYKNPISLSSGPEYYISHNINLVTWEKRELKTNYRTTMTNCEWSIFLANWLTTVFPETKLYDVKFNEIKIPAWYKIKSHLRGEDESMIYLEEDPMLNYWTVFFWEIWSKSQPVWPYRWLSKFNNGRVLVETMEKEYFIIDKLWNKLKEIPKAKDFWYSYFKNWWYEINWIFYTPELEVLKLPKLYEPQEKSDISVFNVSNDWIISISYRWWEQTRYTQLSNIKWVDISTYFCSIDKQRKWVPYKKTKLEKIPWYTLTIVKNNWVDEISIYSDDQYLWDIQSLGNWFFTLNWNQKYYIWKYDVKSIFGVKTMEEFFSKAQLVIEQWNNIEINWKRFQKKIAKFK